MRIRILDTTKRAAPAQSDEPRPAEQSEGERGFRRLTFVGYAATWGSPNALDRDGEFFTKGAFSKSLPDFLAKNPVVLLDHRSEVASVAGRIVRAEENAVGLLITAEISGAPALRNVRELISEGTLKTMSVGGRFRFSDSDPRAIIEAELLEVSLTPVPANPEARVIGAAWRD